MIDIRNVKKKFGRNEVLKGVNLIITKGETLVVIGKSGCGKSVLLKHIIGILKPDEGEIFFEGVDIVKMKLKEIYKIRAKLVFFSRGQLCLIL